jgi:predicted esterase
METVDRDAIACRSGKPRLSNMTLSWSDQVARECRIQPRVFLVGVSAGATFVQGYAFAYPDAVAGVASLSAGDYYEPNPQAKGIPFLVVIGERDNALGLKNARLFARTLEGQGFTVELQVLAEQGHTVSVEARELTMQLFQRLLK